MITVIMPSRSRPDAALQALQSAYQTADLEDTHVIVVADQKDPALRTYQELIPEENLVVTIGNMVERTNFVARLLAAEDPYGIVGWMADDNRFRTIGWDGAVMDTIDALAMHGSIVALNDYFWSERGKPVNIFWPNTVTSHLGWFAMPLARHLYVDDAWKLLAVSTDSFRYLKQVVCEHLHPATGKAEWDAQYRSTENPDMYQHDSAAFIHWIQTAFPDDRAKVLLGLHQYRHSK